MSYSINTLKNELAGVLHGTSVDKVTNLYGIFNRTARQLQLDVDMQETRRIVSAGQVFNSVYDYAAPSDLKGNRIIDIRPQAGRKGDVFPQRFNQFFDKQKWLANQNMFTVQHNTGVKSLRIDAPFLTAPVVLADTSSVTPWSAGGTASSPTIDTAFNVAGGGAIVFNLTAGTGYIEATTLTPVDLTDHLLVAQEFFWAYFPSAPTSIEYRWGSDASNYYYSSQTAQSDGTAFVIGWNRIGAPWATASVSGSPTITAYDTIRFSVVAPVSMIGVKFCYATSIIGSILEVEYYSKYLFRNATTNAFQETVLDDNTDLETIINLDTESYNLFFNLCAYFTAQQLQGGDAKADADYWEKQYKESRLRYKNLYPSEIQPVQESYYQVTNGGYDGFVPRIGI